MTRLSRAEQPASIYVPPGDRWVDGCALRLTSTSRANAYATSGQRPGVFALVGHYLIGREACASREETRLQ